MVVVPLIRFFKHEALEAQAIKFASKPITRMLVIQPTSFCNINCDYCYLPDRSDKSKISIYTVERAIERLIEDNLLGSELTIVWHAGEPLAIPPNFYVSAFDLINERVGSTCKITHSIQTNGILIDSRWCNLIIDYNVQVGISLDGPEQFHDAHRKTRDGRGTHKSVMRGIERLREHDIPFSAIAVVTADSIDHPDVLYRFFCDLGARAVGFSFDEAEGTNLQSSLTSRIGEHRQFMQRLLELSCACSASTRFQIREFDNAYSVIANGLPLVTVDDETFPDTIQTIPFRIISVSHSGAFSTFAPELLGQPSAEFNNFILGNVHAQGYLDSTSDETFQRIWKKVKSGLNLCESDCNYFKYCGGGSPANKLYENGTFASSETLFCQAMIQNPFEVILSQLEADLVTETISEY